ncbi:MAG: hypothetical protein ACXVCF_14260, partial [Isosphaeraceae bacterium]
MVRLCRGSCSCDADEGKHRPNDLKALQPDEAYYGAMHQGAEIDLVLFEHGRRLGLECERKDAPTLTT